MRVTVVRPTPTTNETFHVHAEGCRDLNARRYRLDDGGWTIDANTKREVVEDTYADQIAENANTEGWNTWEAYAHDFLFHPCANLPTDIARKKDHAMPATITPIAERGAVAQARFDYLVAHAALEVVADGWIVNEDETAEMIDTGSGWLVRATNAPANTGILMDRWDAARLIRDWDGPIAIAS